MRQGKRAVGPMEVIGIVVVVALVVAAVLHRRGIDESTDASANPVQSSYSGLPQRTPTSSARAEAAGPFQGTPAQNYAKGEAGIVLPAVKAVPGAEEAMVKNSLDSVRRALIAGRLDNRMLVGHDPSEFLTTLDPGSRAEIADYFKDDSFSTVATWIDPAVKLDSAEPPRVNGTITYTSVPDNEGEPELQVTTNFMWVYAFQGGYPRIAAVHDEIVWTFPQRGLGPSPHKSTSYMAWMDCAAARKGLLRPGVSTDVNETGSTEDPDAMLDSGHGLDIKDSCS